MNLLPNEQFYLQTSLSLSEAVRLIAIPLDKRDDYSSNTESLNGEEAVTFQIQPVIQYRNSFLPVITGTVKTTLNGCQIQVKMTLPSVSYAFLLAIIAWGVIEVFVLAKEGSIVFSSNSLSMERILPMLAFIPLVVIIISAFKFEAYRNRRSLIRRLNAIVLEQ